MSDDRPGTNKKNIVTKPLSFSVAINLIDDTVRGAGGERSNQAKRETSDLCRSARVADNLPQANPCRWSQTESQALTAEMSAYSRRGDCVVLDDWVVERDGFEPEICIAVLPRVRGGQMAREPEPPKGRGGPPRPRAAIIGTPGGYLAGAKNAMCRRKRCHPQARADARTAEGHRFESPPLHQEVRANGRDVLRHEIARYFSSLPRQGPV